MFGSNYMSLHIQLKLHERLEIHELGKMHGNDTEYSFFLSERLLMT